MRRYLLDLLAFAAFAAPVYLLLLIGWGEVMPGALRRNLSYPLGGTGHMHTRIADIEAHRDVDILFLGSSQAYRGFDPRIFAAKGWRAFNLGSSAQTPVQTRVLLERHLDYLGPDVVVYDVYPSLFMNDGVESAVDLLANGPLDQGSLRMVRDVGGIKTYHALLYGSYRRLLGRDVGFREAAERNRDRYVSGGLVERELAFFDGRAKKPPIPWQPRENQWRAFEAIMGMLGERGIRVVLIQTPVTSASRYPVETRRELAALFGRYARYYDFNDLLNLTDEVHFYDTNHLNEYGITLFNERLFHVLAADGHLPARH